MQNPFSNTDAFGQQPGADARFAGERFSITRKMLQMFGATLYLYDQNGGLVLWAQQKAFKLKEDLRLYSDENKSQEILSIKARSIMDFSAAYDVVDSRTGEKLGAFKRKGLASAFVQDTWVLMDNADREIGTVTEDSLLWSILRRLNEWVALLSPQKYTLTVGGQVAGTYKRVKNPFSSKMEIDFSGGANFDRRLGLALALLLEAVEGKQR